MKLAARVWAAVWDLHFLKTRFMHARLGFNALTLRRNNLLLPAATPPVDYEASRGQQEAGRVNIDADLWRDHSTDVQRWNINISLWLGGCRVRVSAKTPVTAERTKFKNRHCR